MITGHLEVLDVGLGDDHSGHEYLASIIDACERSVALTIEVLDRTLSNLGANARSARASRLSSGRPERARGHSPAAARTLQVTELQAFLCAYIVPKHFQVSIAVRL